MIFICSFSVTLDRCQRIRVGVSYPNLNSICDDDFTSSDDQAIESSEENKDSFHSRCSSNPDLLNVMNGGMSSSPSPSSSYTIAIVDIENTISSTTTLASDTSDSINDCVSFYSLFFFDHLFDCKDFI